MYKIYGMAGIFSGLSILFFGKFIGKSFRSTYFDSEDRYLYGGIFLILGFILFLTGMLKKETMNFDEEKFLACPQCGKPYNILDVTNNTCPICKVDLEPMEDFYDRHPEFKDE